MHINTNEVGYLMRLTEWVIRIEEAILEQDEKERPDDFDQNDLIIFHDFILGVLKNHRETGLDTERLSPKGVRFLNLSIPDYLEREAPTLSEEEMGFLIRFYLIHQSAELHDYAGWVKSCNIAENLSSLGHYLNGMVRVLAYGVPKDGKTSARG